MTVDTAYKIIQFAINKSQNGYLTPDEFNLIMPQASTSYMAYLLGPFQKYQNGRPMAPVEIGYNGIILERLSPFISTEILTLDGSGQTDMPENWQHIVAINYGAKKQRVRFVQQDSLFSYLDSVIDPVESNPIYTIEGGKLTFYPATVSGVSMSTLKTQEPIKWAFNLDSNNRPVYDPDGSVDPLWLDVDMFEVMARALALVGVNLQSQAVAQYSEMIKQGGQ